MPNDVVKKCASACLLTCVHQGVADTTSTKFFYPKKIQTTRDGDPRINMCRFSTEGTDSTCSTNHDTESCSTELHPVPRPRKMPTCYCVPTRIAPDVWQNPCNVNSRQTQSKEFHTLSNLPLVLDGPDIGLFVFCLATTCCAASTSCLISRRRATS